MSDEATVTEQLRDAMCRVGLPFTAARKVSVDSYDFGGQYPYLFCIRCADAGGHVRQVHRVESRDEFQRLLRTDGLILSLASAVRWITVQGEETEDETH